MKPVCILLVLLAGCATLENVPLSERSRLIDAPHDAVYQAVLEKAAENGYSLHANTTARAGSYVAGVRSGADMAALYPIIQERDIHLEAQLTPVGSDQTKVTLSFLIEDVYPALGTISATMSASQAEEIYAYALDRIEERARALRTD